LDVTILNRQRGHTVDRAELSDFLRRVAREVPCAEGATLALALVSERRMRELNREFRGHNGTTDVLSFPGGDEPDPDGSTHVGDIVISVPTAARQAELRGHSLDRELMVLTLHGYLHLLGYDHETDDGEMLRLERRLEGRLLGRHPSGPDR
jgi:probable rRNA maturation factor